MKLTPALRANEVEVFSLRGLRISKQRAVDQFKTGNWQALRRLNRICEELNITTVRQLYQTHWEELWEAGAGYMTLLVASHILEDRGFDRREWIDRKRRRS